MVLSFVMEKRVLGPLTAMARLTRDIAAGNYDVDIPVRTTDEVGHLAMAEAAVSSLQPNLFDMRGLIERTLE